MGALEPSLSGIIAKVTFSDRIHLERTGCFYETDFIVCCSGNDLISQQYRSGSSFPGAGCIRTSRFLCDACFCSAIFILFPVSAPVRPVAEREKDSKRLTVKARKIKIYVTAILRMAQSCYLHTKRGKAMRKKRFLAIAAAIAVSMSVTVPMTVFATEAEETADIIDDELEEGEQMTIEDPGEADSDSDSNDGSTSGGSGSDTTGNSGGSSSGTTGSTGGSGSGTTGSAGNVKSSDSSLAHLGISPGSLSPAFSAGTHEYTATVDAGVTSISVAAKPNNSKAVIASVSGAKSLAPGANTVKVVVEAENGATTTYTIQVTCGSAASSAPVTDQTDPSGETDGENVLEGEVSIIQDSEETQEKKPAVTFDSNGYLIYEGNAYIPSSMMPEGEYVSLDKYNKLYDQSQTQKKKDMRLLIILIVLFVLSLIVILNLALKLRDVRQDVKLGLNGIEDDEERKKKPRQKANQKPKQTDTSMIPDVRIPDSIKMERASRPAKTEKPVKSERTEKPAKPEKPTKKAEDLEILDLNDL